MRRASLPLRLKEKTYIMGVLNITPDSFSDGGEFFDHYSAVHRGMEMAQQGADIIDVGGESTRPGAKAISLEEELKRAIPVIKALAEETDALVSIDTRKARVAEEAVRAGAAIINDVSGLCHDPDMGRVAAKYKTGLIVMHMKGAPENMQVNPVYMDLMKELIGGLGASIKAANKAGVAKENIIIDPGIGFGKTVEHNLEILNRLEELKILKFPICVGTSRKSFIGKALNIPDAGKRLAGTIATCVLAIMKGAAILRVHDVKEVFDAARITDMILKAKAA